MAEVFNNIFVRGLRGAVGDQFVIRRTRSGKTIIANKPRFDENREFTDLQLAQQSAFKQATTYAKSAKTQPVYVEKAKAFNSTSYNLAVADWFHKPEVLDINASGWTGQIGQRILIRAEDDTKVTHVRVVIHNGNGTIHEQGEAVQSEIDNLLWTYTITTFTPMNPAPIVEAKAYDLPGNFGAATVQLG
jgi:hypothetical protein